MPIEYTHATNTVDGASAALRLIFSDGLPESLLDVGCGQGAWMKAASDCGVLDIYGIDGVDACASGFLLTADRFQQIDLSAYWDLKRKFSAVICLEVAEHLPEGSAALLINTLCGHSDTIVFSAACPGQPGQHHVNCKWPSYWQALFNGEGFTCSDDVRWKLWMVDAIEPWYRQNIFFAVKNPSLAGREERIEPVVHPELFGRVNRFMSETFSQKQQELILQGHLPTHFYLLGVTLGLVQKVARNCFSRRPVSSKAGSSDIDTLGRDSR